MKRSAPTLRSALIRLGCAAALLAAAAGVFLWRNSQLQRDETQFDLRVVPPTCTDSGYTLHTSRINGSTYVDTIVPATGHDFTPWQQQSAAGELELGSSSRTCRVCGAVEERLDDPGYSIPTLMLEGSLDGIGKKTEVHITARFAGAEDSFETFATLKYQGHDSLAYSKKNYTLKFFLDEARADKYKMTFSHWNEENKYILKANYVDPTQCRNLVCADVWADMVSSREDIPAELTALSNYGAVDGFPIALYIGGRFQGLYNFNLHKDDDLFAMEEGEQHAIMIANFDDGGEACFRAPAAFGDDTPWEVEFCGTEDSAWAKDKLNALIEFVQTADDETFRKELGQYLDVDSAVDYLLAVYALGLTRHGASDLMLVTYGADRPFIASLYDMETAFGLLSDGTGTLPADQFLPAQTPEGWDSATGSLLFDRILEVFGERLRSRYAELRSGVLDSESLCARVEAFTAAIDEELYTLDAAVSGYGADETVCVEQITQYIRQRMQLLDQIFLEKEG